MSSVLMILLILEAKLGDNRSVDWQAAMPFESTSRFGSPILGAATTVVLSYIRIFADVKA